ncbi:MAG: gluconokinase [Phycisphaeraceae bacterium]|nr:gluconokinase [Phycisphaeraceae bacterium]
MYVIFMGVSGVGKTAVGQRVADALSIVFADADDYHPQGNVQKMRAGLPLTDSDRWPWLKSLNTYLQQQDHGCILACSALKSIYRDRLVAGLDDVRWVYLKTDRDTLLKRMQQREHFMPASLLDSQLSTLIPPTGDQVITVDATLLLDQVVAEVLDALSR